MRGIEDPKTKLPELKNDGRMHVSLFGNYFEQNKVIIPNNNNVINIYCVYELRQVNIPLIIEFAILNALFGAMEITKNADTSKYKYKGYGICFDKGGSFSEDSINNGRNVNILVFTNALYFTLIIKLIIFMSWVKALFKESTTRHCMQKKYTVKILLNQTKSLY